MSKQINNAVFLASAGTGKTYQVVNLYLSLLLDKQFPAEGSGIDCKPPVYSGGAPVDCRDILMLTFAKNAASEMRSRITTNIENEMSEVEDDHHLWGILRSISSANISTIHSFAQRLLRENAVLASLSPSANLVEDDESTEMMNSAIEHELFALLPINKNIESIYSSKRPSDFIETTAKFISSLKCKAIDVSALDLATIETMVSEPAKPTIENLTALAEKAEPMVSANERCNNGRAFCEEVRSYAASHEKGVSPEDIARKAQSLQADHIKGKTWTTEPGYKELRDNVSDELSKLCAHDDHLKARACLIDYLAFVSECSRKYDAAKKTRGVLDYSDLLSMAVKLIEEHPETVPKFKVIIVDEAQDNSRIQNRLIDGIRKASDSAVILCGDRKQMIYGWRGAEDRGMEEMAGLLDGAAEIPLYRSFRSQSGILDWVNGISSSEQMFGSKYTTVDHLTTNDLTEHTTGPNVELLLPDWEYGADPLENIDVPPPRSKAKKPPEVKPRNALTGTDIGRLASAEEVGEDGSAEEEAGEWTMAQEQYGTRLSDEARAIAWRIKLLCSGQTDREWKPKFTYNESEGEWAAEDTPRYRYKDILILLRATTNQHMYEAALRELDIPYSADGRGKGFYFRQEVRDIVSLVTALAYEKDGVSILAVARSPFAGLSDPAIATLSRATDIKKFQGSVFRDALQGDAVTIERNATKLVEFGLNDDAEAYRRTVDLISRLRVLAGRVSVVDLVREAIKLSGFDAILAGSFHGAQKLANMRKMLSTIQDLERRNNLDLQAVAKRLNDEVGQTEAPDAIIMDPADDSVKISTIHSAKGLTFPVIVLPDLSRSLYDSKDWLQAVTNSDNSHSIAGKFQTVNEDGSISEIETDDYAEARDTATLLKLEESERLFYVAQTRPRDLMILSGSSVSDKTAWRCWVNEYVGGLDESSRKEQMTFIPYSRVMDASAGDSADSDSRPPVTPERLATAEALIKPPEERTKTRMAVTTLTRTPSDETDTAAVVEFRKSALVGLAPAWVRSRNSSDGNDNAAENDIDYAERGTRAHATLESIDFDSHISPREQVEAQIDSVTESIKDGLAAAADYLAAELAGAEHIIRELPFCAKFEHDDEECYIDGKIDLIYLKDGAWHIVDYKFTNAVKSKLMKSYGFQLLVYRNAISRPADDGQREILLAEAETDALVRMRILGMAEDGTLTVVDIDDGRSDDAVAAQVIDTVRIYNAALK